MLLRLASCLLLFLDFNPSQINLSELFLMVIICQMLAKKVDTLTKAMEVEAKKMRMEVANMEKEVAAMRVEKEQDNRAKRFSNIKGPGPVNSAQNQLISGRYFFFSTSLPLYAVIGILFTLLAFFCNWSVAGGFNLRIHPFCSLFYLLRSTGCFSRDFCPSQRI
jgi:hypothetical protein